MAPKPTGQSSEIEGNFAGTSARWRSEKEREHQGHFHQKAEF
jgi:hypothetical protein